MVISQNFHSLICIIETEILCTAAGEIVQGSDDPTASVIIATLVTRA